MLTDILIGTLSLYDTHAIDDHVKRLPFWFRIGHVCVENSVTIAPILWTKLRG
jgi:hypothetical protein